MDLKKIGMFLKEQRKEKGITQEELAQILNVSNRTISRWENGKNMPDFDVLVEIADYYQIEIREILDGERKSDNMNKEVEETVLQVADYTSAEAQNHNKRINRLFLFAIVFYMITLLFEGYLGNMKSGFFKEFSDGFLKGGMLGIVLVGFIMTSRYGKRMRDFKMRILQKMKKSS